jgi:damage-control phosphatase, subfamily I
MGESRVGGARENIMTPSKLLYPTEPLKIGAIDDEVFRLSERDKPMDGVENLLLVDLSHSLFYRRISPNPSLDISLRLGLDFSHMKSEQGCAGCIIDDISGAVRLMKVDEKKQLEVINACMDYLSKEFNFDTIPSTFITGVHRIAKTLTGQRLPFEELRKNCNDVGLKLSAKLQKELAPKKDTLGRFQELVKWVIAGNHLDFRTVGTGYHVPIKVIEKHVRDKVAEPLSVNDVPKFYKLLNDATKKKAKGRKPHALFIHDNVGEIAFDRLLIADMKARGWFVTSALRGGPITSDATLEDGVYVHIEDYADMVICAGPDTLGISWEEKSEELDQALRSSDLIISKGQANFYLFSERAKEIGKPVMCLLTTKCPYVSSYFKHTKLISCAKLL